MEVHTSGGSPLDTGRNYVLCDRATNTTIHKTIWCIYLPLKFVVFSVVLKSNPLANARAPGLTFIDYYFSHVVFIFGTTVTTNNDYHIN